MSHFNNGDMSALNDNVEEYIRPFSLKRKRKTDTEREKMEKLRKKSRKIIINWKREVHMGCCTGRNTRVVYVFTF